MSSQLLFLLAVCNIVLLRPAFTTALDGGDEDKKAAAAAAAKTLQQRAKQKFTEHLSTTAYDHGVPPNFPGLTPVNISVWFGFLQSFDVASETLKILIQFDFSWIDDRIIPSLLSAVSTNDTTDISSNSTQFSLLVPVSDHQLWLPPTDLVGRKSRIDDSYLLQQTTLTAHSPHGIVRLVGVVPSDDLHCAVRARAFPFDTQNCEIALSTWHNVVWHYDQNKIEALLHALLKDEKQKGWFFETGAWSLATDPIGYEQMYGNSSVTRQGCPTGTGRCTISFHVVLRRKWAQYISAWLVTPIVLSMSSVVGMYAGCERGERFSFGGAMVVTMTLLQSELRSDIATGIDGYPIMGILYMGLTYCLIMATLLSATPEYVHENWLRKARDEGKRWASASSELAEKKNFLWKLKNMSERTLNYLVMGWNLLAQCVIILAVLVMWWWQVESDHQILK